MKTLTKCSKIELVKKGNLITRKDFYLLSEGENKSLFVYNGYCRFNKGYEIENYYSGKIIYLKKGTLIYNND